MNITMEWIKPYLDYFGVPYTIWDIATNPTVPDLESFAVIIIGHDQLDYYGDLPDAYHPGSDFTGSFRRYRPGEF